MKGNVFVVARWSEVTLKLNLKLEVLKFENSEKKVPRE
jgi:hypothetical protein